MIHCNLH